MITWKESEKLALAIVQFEISIFKEVDFWFIVELYVWQTNTVGIRSYLHTRIPSRRLYWTPERRVIVELRRKLL